MDEKKRKQLFDEYQYHKKFNLNCIEFLKGALGKAMDFEEKDYLLSILAMEYEQTGDFDEAETTLKHIISLDPTIGPSWLQLGKFYAKVRKDFEASIECMNKALYSCPPPNSGSFHINVDCLRIALILERKDIATATLERLLDLARKGAKIPLKMEPSLIDNLKNLGVDQSLMSQIVTY